MTAGDRTRLFVAGQPLTRRPRSRPAFGTNRHLVSPRIRQVVSEITGRPCGYTVEHGDGRVDGAARTEPVRWSAEDVERLMPLNDLRRLIYEKARENGASHDEAIARLFPDGKVLA